VLPLVVGRATRLARFLDDDKLYEASIRLGLATDTYDHLGSPIGPEWKGPWPDRTDIEAALEAFRGTFLQQPPAFSAKKIGGRRSYALARRAAAVGESGQPTRPAAVQVTTRSVDITELAGSLLRLRVHCSSGFYVRSLAHELGAAVGVSGHLIALRRTKASGFGLCDAVSLEAIESGGAALAMAALVPMDRMLTALPTVALTEAGVTLARRGSDIGPSETIAGFTRAVSAVHSPSASHVRLVDSEGHLVAMAEASEAVGFLHPSVVLM
jgi:tRNA pseudouridine55 synthase